MPKLIVSLTAEQIEFLRVLGGVPENLDDHAVVDTILTLVVHAVDGMRRPGSWERGWLEQVPFFTEWQSKLETVDRWYQRPRKAGR